MTIPVTLPSGELFPAETEAEADLLNERRDLYWDQAGAPNRTIAELVELDRVLVLEALIHRWSTQDPDAHATRILEYSAEVREIKKGLGIDYQTQAAATEVHVVADRVSVADDQLWVEASDGGALVYVQADASGNYLTQPLSIEDCRALAGWFARRAADEVPPAELVADEQLISPWRP